MQLHFNPHRTMQTISSRLVQYYIEGRSNLRSAATGKLCVPRTKICDKTDNRPTGIRC